MTETSRKAPLAALWVLAAAAGLLAASSATGDGTGLFGSGVLTAPWLAWLVFFAMATTIVVGIGWGPRLRTR